MPEMLHAGGVCLEEVCTCAGMPLLASYQTVRVDLGRLTEGREKSRRRILARGSPFGCTTHPWRATCFLTLPVPTGDDHHYPHHDYHWEKEEEKEEGESKGPSLGVSLSYLASQEVPPPFPSHIACDVGFTVRTPLGTLVAHRTLLNHFNADTPTWGIGQLVPIARLQSLMEQEGGSEEDGVMRLIVQVVVQPLETQGGWIDGGIAEGCPGVEDVLLYAQGGQEAVTAARVSLASRSPYFRDIFLADFPYPPPDDYPIDEKPRILQWLIHYAYHGTIPTGLTTEDYRELYAASTRLRFPDLRAILSARLTRRLDLTSALALVPLAWEYGDPPMKSALLRLLRRERRGLAGREDFVRLVRTGAYKDLVESLIGSTSPPSSSPSSSSSSINSALPPIS